ncbi:MAG: hypothetical protein WCI18_16765 [Pseudomonadota bacterium]
MQNSKYAVSDCKSGFRSQAVQGAPLMLYPGDYGCLVKLTEFVMDGDTFSPSDSDPFTTWLPGDSAIFQGRLAPSKLIAVTITSQVSSPLQAQDQVIYKIGILQGSGSQPISLETIVLPRPTLVADFAPQWKLTSMQLFGFSREGKGTYQFELQCKTRMVGSGLNSKCANVPLGELSYILVEDLWRGSPSVYEMTQLFSAGTRKISSSEVIAPSATKNGGFRTKAPRDKSALEGPVPLSHDSKMLLIIRNAKSGFRIFQLGGKNGTK